MNTKPSIELKGNFDFNNTARSILSAFNDQTSTKYRLTDYVANMQGMSGRKYRYWINNFISLEDNPRYLEVGSWAGSTACSAMVGNKLSLTCIDNWSQFGGSKDIFLGNVEKCINSEIKFKLFEMDFREVDYTSIGKFSVYLFDGPHTEGNQYDGIALALPALDETFTLIVDDWNWEAVQNGTIQAIKEFQVNVHCSITIKTNNNPVLEASDWHNGYFIALCSKKTHT